MKYDLIPFGLLVEDPEQNPRKTFKGIADLAELIATDGLLQNLVVTPGPDGTPFFDKERGSYIVKAGSRRYRAIKRIIDERIPTHDGQWTYDTAFPCVIVETESEFTALIENEGRQDVYPWESGARFEQLTERGYTQKEVAKRIGKEQPYVSRCVKLHRGLAPRVKTMLARAGISALTDKQLDQIASLVSGHTGDPDEAAQVRLLDDFWSTPGKRKKRVARDLATLPLRERLFVRFRTLRYQASLPVEVRPQVDAILDYLEGKTDKLNMKPWGLSE